MHSQHLAIQLDVTRFRVLPDAPHSLSVFGANNSPVVGLPSAAVVSLGYVSEGAGWNRHFFSIAKS